MNSKIIGFTVSSFPINHGDVDIFRVGLAKKFFRYNNLYIYLWGIGNLDKCYIQKDVISLSFPLNDRLDDKNVLIRLKEGGVEVENDWLGSIPIFYNTKKVIVSTLINKTFTKDDSAIDPDGLNNYLDFGFCVLEHTPFSNVRFTRYFSKLTIATSKCRVFYKKDIFLKDSKKESTTNVAVSANKKLLNSYSKKIEGNIIIPTSGGFDSRLLNLLLSDKKRIRAYTYGISPQTKTVSSEVAKANKLSQILGVSWSEVKLIGFNKYYKQWFELFGCATHLHGMYHIEFYKKIKKLTKQPSSLLSGIFNETWSGLYPVPIVNGPKDVVNLGNTHGINSDSKISKFHRANDLNHKFFNRNKTILKNRRRAMIFLVRFRIMLLSYLLRVPDYLGFPSWTPFLNFEVVDKMLHLSQSKRAERKWLQDFFERKGVLIEKMNIVSSSVNTLEEDASRYSSIPNIEINILKRYIKNYYLFSISNNYRKLVKNNFYDYLFMNKLFEVGLFSMILTKLNFKKTSQMKIFTDVTILKSLEMTSDMILKKQ